MSSIVETRLVAQDKYLQSFLVFCRDHKIFQPGDRVIVAVSGGLDSTVLLHLMSRASKLLGIELEVAHIDHAQRNLSSSREGAWVGVLSDRLTIKHHRFQLDADPGSSHMQLRELRRNYLEELLALLSATKIVTAHHADDNAETFLIRAISGTGVNGLRSMSPVKGQWVKPLLWATKEDLRAYALMHSLPWVEDPSNSRTEYLRNKIRTDVLDSLELARPGALRAIARTAVRIDEEERELETWIDDQLMSQNHGGHTLSVGWVETWPKTLQRRIFRIWLSKLGIETQPKLVEDLLSGREIVHSRGVFLKRSSMWVFLSETTFGKEWKQPVPVNVGGRISLGESMAWSFCPSAPEVMKSFKHIVYLVLKDPRNVLHNSMVLAWRRLPREIGVLGAKLVNSQEVMKIMEQARIPTPYRANWPVLVDMKNAQLPLAVVGLGPIKEFEWSGDGPALVIQSFFEEGLSSAEGSC